MKYLVHVIETDFEQNAICYDTLQEAKEYIKELKELNRYVRTITLYEVANIKEI